MVKQQKGEKTEVFSKNCSNLTIARVAGERLSHNHYFIPRRAVLFDPPSRLQWNQGRLFVVVNQNNSVPFGVHCRIRAAFHQGQELK